MKKVIQDMFANIAHLKRFDLIKPGSFAEPVAIIVHPELFVELTKENLLRWHKLKPQIGANICTDISLDSYPGVKVLTTGYVSNKQITIITEGMLKIMEDKE